MDGTASDEDMKARRLFFVIMAISGSLSFIDIALNYKALEERYIHQVSYLLYLPASVYGMILILFKRPLTNTVMVGTAYLVAASVLLVDLSARTLGNTFWPSLVLIVDFLLVMKVATRHSFIIVCTTVFWILLLGLEETYRFGLFDIPGMPVQDGEFGRRKFYTVLLSCERPPCANNTLGKLATPLSVFVIDFIATRGFAREVLKEQASMEKTINIVQVIASLLGQYDVEGVANLLALHESDLPAEMTSALRRLEQNLRIYKSYLPKTCLPFDKEVPAEEERDCEEDSSIASRVSSSVSSSVLRAQTTRTVLPPIGLTTVKATLLTLNIKDTFSMLEGNAARFSEFFGAIVLRALRATEPRRGMVDVFVGDRVHCSFNASRLCANHASSALHTVLILQDQKAIEADVNMGVATGNVLRGDMGCDGMRRFSMVGPLVRDVHGMERAGRALGCNVVCNRMCFSDADCEHQLRLLPCRVEVDNGCHPEHVGELLPHASASASAAEEWMYTIGGKSDWETYNIVVRKYLKGKASAEDVIDAAAQGACANTPLNVVPGSVKGDLLCLPVRTARPQPLPLTDASVSVITPYDNEVKK